MEASQPPAVRIASALRQAGPGVLCLPRHVSMAVAALLASCGTEMQNNGMVAGTQEDIRDGRTTDPEKSPEQERRYDREFYELVLKRQREGAEKVNERLREQYRRALEACEGYEATGRTHSLCPPDEPNYVQVPDRLAW